MDSSQTQIYKHDRLHLAGGTLPEAITAYRTYGSPEKPCIVFPTCYGAKLDSQLYLVGPGKVFDPSKYYVVTFALFSNGESSSPSNTPPPFNGPHFPEVTYEDNIRAQHVVLTKALGIKKVFCVVGFSMGGQQAYHWPTIFPDFVERFIVICGSARTSPHNICFLEGPKAAMLASKDFDGGHYKTTPSHGIRAFGRVYSAWAYGQTWYREHGYLFNGEFSNLNSFLRDRWEGRYLAAWDANDMLTLLNTWQKGDISKVTGGSGNLEETLKGIKAKGLIMPCKTDLYFTPEDNVYEMQHLTNSKLVIIDSIWGHVAGGGANSADTEFMEQQIAAFLEE